MADQFSVCQANRKDGSPCRVSFALSDDGLCSAHDPARQAMREAALTKSVEVRQQRRIVAKTVLPEGMLRRPKTLDDAVRWSAWSMHACVTGVIDARTAHEVGYLVNAFTASLQKRDMQREIEKLRAELAAAKQQSSRRSA